jgi:predicted XRE-type DNA-binding protein
VEASEISDVLEGALKEASDDKQKEMLSLLLRELKTRPPGV